MPLQEKIKLMRSIRDSIHHTGACATRENRACSCDYEMRLVEAAFDIGEVLRRLSAANV